MTDTPMKDATEAMIAAAGDWLTPLDAPACAQLRLLADQLDEGGASGVAAIASAYGLVYRSLLKRAPAVDGPVDPLEALLAGAESGR